MINYPWYLIVGGILYLVGLIIMAIEISDLIDFFAFAIIYFVVCIFWYVVLILAVIFGVLAGLWHLIKFLKRRLNDGLSTL